MRRFINWFLGLFRKSTPITPIEKIAAAIESDYARTELTPQYQREQEKKQIHVQVDLDKVPKAAQVTGATRRTCGRRGMYIQLPVFANGDQVEVSSRDKDDINDKFRRLVDHRNKVSYPNAYFLEQDAQT